MAWCLAASALWAVSLSLFRGPIGSFGPVAANLFKCTVAAALYIAVLAGTGTWVAPATTADWFALGLSGIIGFAIGDWCLFVSVREGGLQRALVLFNTSPLMTAVLGAAFLGDLPTARGWVGMGLVVAGVALVETDPRRGGAPAGPPEAGRPAGKAWLATLAGLGAAAGQAAGIVLAAGPLRRVPVLPATTVRLVPAIAVVLVWLLLAREGRGLRAMPARSWAALALPTVLGTVIALPLAMKGQATVAPGIAASLLATTPIFALPISVFALREPVGPASLAGTVLAVAGVALLS